MDGWGSGVDPAAEERPKDKKYGMEERVLVKELCGKHHFIPSVPEMRVADLAAAMGPHLSCSADRIVFAFAGRQLDRAKRVADLNLPLHGFLLAFVEFMLPERYRDGNCHPFSLNGVLIGGDLRADVAADVGRDDFLRLVDQLPAPGAGLEAIGDANTDDSAKLAGETGRELPACLREFLALDSRMFCKLSFSPLAPPRAVWTESFRVLREANRVLCCILFDHQGCCYWYLDVESLEVFVVFGGQTFADGGYLTSRSLWRFLCEYAAATRE